MDDTENRCLNCGNDSPCSCTEPMPAAEVYARHRERQAAAAGQRYEPHCDCNGGHVQMISDPSGRWHLADDSASSIVQQMPEAGNEALEQLRAQHAAWSQAQFGDVSAVGPAKHLAKEAMEVAADPLDPIEHADCWMLLWDMQRRAGISDAQLADAIREKLAINQARRWPAPKEGEAREHERADQPEDKA